MSSGFIMKSCGVPAAPLSAKALPGSERLVPKTTIPENDDCAVAVPGNSSSATAQATIKFRTNDGEMRAVVTMDVSSQNVGGRVFRDLPTVLGEREEVLPKV